MDTKTGEKKETYVINDAGEKVLLEGKQKDDLIGAQSFIRDVIGKYARIRLHEVPYKIEDPYLNTVYEETYKYVIAYLEGKTVPDTLVFIRRLDGTVNYYNSTLAEKYFYRFEGKARVELESIEFTINEFMKQEDSILPILPYPKTIKEEVKDLSAKDRKRWRINEQERKKNVARYIKESTEDYTETGVSSGAV